jgi:uncharacterized repeat protein (TIGR01451 family)
MYLMEMGDTVLSSALSPQGFRENFLPFEDLSIIRNGLFQQADKARLATSIDAAIIWTKDDAVQVVIDGQAAGEVAGDQRAQITYMVDDSRGPAKLRVVKVASTDTARPGDTVDFTVRFDNVGDQLIGNVTILDNLVTRLEYVPDSAQSSVEAAFSSQMNEGGSSTLRWEITEPMKPGEGGIVRFRTRVR